MNTLIVQAHNSSIVLLSVVVVMKKEFSDVISHSELFFITIK